jgi:nucleoside-diphosphate-sugar epimerase
MVNGSPLEIDAIIHLAGKAHDTKNQSAADVYFKVNTELTKKIYDYYLKSKAKKFIFFSSVKAAADSVEGEFVDENVVPSPKGPYGESKIAAERYILSQPPFISKETSETDSSQAKKVYILRPCMIHGPGNKGNLNLLYGVVKKGIPWPLGAFENKRTFTSIDNLCFIIEGLLTQDVESDIYNINDDEAVSTNELIDIICSAMGKKAHIWRIPRGLMEGVAKIGGALHLPLNPERLRKLTENYVSSNAKIKKALGVEKLPVRAKDGLRNTIKSFAKS